MARDFRFVSTTISASVPSGALWPVIFVESDGAQRSPEREDRPLAWLKGPAAGRVVREGSMAPSVACIPNLMLTSVEQALGGAHD